MLTLSKGKDITDPLEQTITLLKENPGHCPLMFQIHTQSEVMVNLSANERWHVHPGKTVIENLRQIWGPEAVHTVND